MRSLSSSVLILVGMLASWAIPAHGQIVSYKDSDGKRVFINAEPVNVVRSARIPLLQTAANGITPSTTQSSYAASLEMSAADKANREKIEQMIREVSARYRVDPALVRAVMQTESNWNSSAVSRKGALGLMQLGPGTAQQLGVNNAFDPKQNLDGGVRYLHMLLERYNGDLDKALAAYNAGPGAVDRAGGIPRYRETRNYVQKVTDSYFRPGSDRLPRAFDERRPIYRAVEADGRVVFTNE
ncbi:MAG: lytic transglycosylase domain-containing protein [Candidatus Acidiferrales bacterium]